jgi:hypothetical protein
VGRALAQIEVSVLDVAGLSAPAIAEACLQSGTQEVLLGGERVPGRRDDGAAETRERLGPSSWRIALPRTRARFLRSWSAGLGPHAVCPPQPGSGFLQQLPVPGQREPATASVGVDQVKTQP